MYHAMCSECESGVSEREAQWRTLLRSTNVHYAKLWPYGRRIPLSPFGRGEEKPSYTLYFTNTTTFFIFNSFIVVMAVGIIDPLGRG
jgi:hypothetical protein